MDYTAYIGPGGFPAPPGLCAGGLAYQQAPPPLGLQDRTSSSCSSGNGSWGAPSASTATDSPLSPCASLGEAPRAYSAPVELAAIRLGSMSLEEAQAGHFLKVRPRPEQPARLQAPLRLSPASRCSGMSIATRLVPAETLQTAPGPHHAFAAPAANVGWGGAPLHHHQQQAAAMQQMRYRPGGPGDEGFGRRGPPARGGGRGPQQQQHMHPRMQGPRQHSGDMRQKNHQGYRRLWQQVTQARQLGRLLCWGCEAQNARPAPFADVVQLQLHGLLLPLQAGLEALTRCSHMRSAMPLAARSRPARPPALRQHALHAALNAPLLPACHPAVQVNRGQKLGDHDGSGFGEMTVEDLLEVGAHTSTLLHVWYMCLPAPTAAATLVASPAG